MSTPMFEAVYAAMQTVEFPEGLNEEYRARVYEWFAPQARDDSTRAKPAIVMVRAAPDYITLAEDQVYRVVGTRSALSTVLALYDILVAAVNASGSLQCISGDRATEVAGADADTVVAELTIRGGAYGCD